MATQLNKKRTDSQAKLRELVLSMSNGYGFLDRHFIVENGLPICIQSIEAKIQQSGDDKGKEKWWVLCTALNAQGVNETGYLTFDHADSRDRFFQALLADSDMLPAHNLYMSLKKMSNGRTYYAFEVSEEECEHCPCTPEVNLEKPF